MNGITYYQTRSPYRGDFTKNCSLNGFEIDSNFLNLEGRDIRRMYTRGCTLYAELYNGETISTSIDSCGGGSGSGSCDCEREINYLEGERDVRVEYKYVIEEGDIMFNVIVPCRLNTNGITNITQEVWSPQINDLTFTPLGEEEPYNSFEISGTYSSGGQIIPIHIYTTGALFKQGVYSDSLFQTNVGICTVYTIEGSYTGNLEFDKENIFRFPIPNEIDDSGVTLIFNEGTRITYEHNHQRTLELFSSTSNYAIIALSDVSIGNILNICQINENHHFVIGILWTDDMVSQDLNLMTPITWSELKSLRDNSQLVPGMQYRITDYDCTTVQENTDSAHHPFDIIVFADDEHTLNENARAAKREGNMPNTIRGYYFINTDDVEDAANQKIFSFGKYDGENNNMFLVVDNNVTYYKLQYNSNIYYAYYDNLNDNYHLCDSNFVDLGTTVTFPTTPTLKWAGRFSAVQNGTEEVNNTTYVRWRITNVNTSLSVFSDNIFGLVNDAYVYSLTDSPNSLADLLYMDNGVMITFVSLSDTLGLIDHSGDNPDISKLRNASSTLTATNNTVYFDNCNLEAWELKYCLDNDANRFAWASDSDMKLLLDEHTYTEEGTFTYNGLTYKYSMIYEYTYGDVYWFDDGRNAPIYLHFTGNIDWKDAPIYEEIPELFIRYNTNISSGLYNLSNEVLLVNNGNVVSFKDYIDRLGIIQDTFGGFASMTQDSQTFDFVLSPTLDGSYTCFELSDIVVYSDYGSNLISMQLPIIGSESRTESLIQIPNNGIMLYAVMGYYTQGKGIIYYMKDDRNNELPYDFKNIMFKRTIDGSDVMLYTFTQTISGTVSDASVYKNSSSKEGVFENIMNPYYTDYNNSVRRSLNQNVFYSSGILLARNNTFGIDCYSNTFANGCSSNTFGNVCTSNTFGIDCYFNTFGDYCYFNTFGDGCYSNTFGDYCYSNTFGDGCISNTFSDVCDFNTFGDGCISNTFGYYCSEIIIEDSNQNTIDNIRFIHVFNNVSGNIYTDSQGNNLAQYATYTQYIAKNSSGQLIIWSPADLAAQQQP